jgi:NADPH2:quinone reductase
MTHAIRIHETGGPEVLRWDEVDVAAPGPGQALVRHTAVGVNYIDTYHRSGLYALPSMPHGVGMEAAGVVEAVGNDVDLAVGTRVGYVAGPPGSYAERRLHRADVLIPLPDDVDDVTAAASLLQGMTVEYLIRRVFAVGPGTTVLWHAAAGGVGLIACQWLRHLGATVIGTVSTDEKAEIARAHGCAHPVIYTREDFVARVNELTDGRGCPVVYDSVGRATFDGSLACVARRGTLVCFGNASGKPEPFDALRLAQSGSIFLTRPTLMDYTRTREELVGSATALFSMIASGAVKIEPRHRWPLREAEAAHRALEARETTGPIVLDP